MDICGGNVEDEEVEGWGTAAFAASSPPPLAVEIERCGFKDAFLGRRGSPGNLNNVGPVILGVVPFVDVDVEVREAEEDAGGGIEAVSLFLSSVDTNTSALLPSAPPSPSSSSPPSSLLIPAVSLSRSAFG